jgi:hypothetical protein
MPFVTIPVAAWIVCGSIKFGINFIRSGSGAFERIGHGGFPSNHTAIVSSLMWTFGLIGEWQMAGLAVAVLMIHVFDAIGLRREVGYHARAINQLSGARLREIMGHKPFEVVGGLGVGLAVALTYWFAGAIA